MTDYWIDDLGTHRQGLRQIGSRLSRGTRDVGPPGLVANGPYLANLLGSLVHFAAIDLQLKVMPMSQFIGAHQADIEHLGISDDPVALDAPEVFLAPFGPGGRMKRNIRLKA